MVVTKVFFVMGLSLSSKRVKGILSSGIAENKTRLGDTPNKIKATDNVNRRLGGGLRGSIYGRYLFAFTKL